MEELVQVIFENPNIEKLSNSGIRTIKNKTIIAPGFWNGRNYTREEIEKCFYNTDWNDPDVISLIADHRDDDSKGRPLTLRDWLGFTSNQYLTDDGFIKADLNICNPTLATQLIEGKAPFGISPFIFGKYDSDTNSQKDFIIKNNAIVVEPACKESYINAYLGDDGQDIELSKLSQEERINSKKEKSQKKEIIEEQEDKKKKLDSSEKDVNNIELKGGQNMKKMVEENIEEVKEESTEVTVSEEVKEEPKEEVEEVKEVSEDLSEDKIVEEIAKLTEKLMNKRKITPEMAKMQKLESDINLLRNEIRKLSESKVEAKSTEKLSAKPKSVMVSGTKMEEGFRGVFKKQPSKGTMEAYQKLSSLGVFN